MPIFPFSDPEFFDNVTTSGMEWVRTGAAEIGWDATAVVLGDVEDDESPVVIMAKVPPGDTMPRHAHSAWRVEVQVLGSLQSGDRLMKPGDVSISAPGEFYGPSVAGPEGSLTAEVIGSIAGITNLIAEEDDPDQAALLAEAKERIDRHRAAARAARD